MVYSIHCRLVRLHADSRDLKVVHFNFNEKMLKGTPVIQEIQQQTNNDKNCHKNQKILST